MMLVSVSFLANAQEPVYEVSPVPNQELTQQEFNYLNKGLRDQEEKGLDMKKGYQLENIGNREVGGYLFEGSVFIEEEFKTYKAISVKITLKSTRKVLHYLVFPLHGNEYSQQYFDRIWNFDATLKQCTLIYTSYLFKDFFNATVELANSKQEKEKLNVAKKALSKMNK